MSAPNPERQPLPSRFRDCLHIPDWSDPVMATAMEREHRYYPEDLGEATRYILECSGLSELQVYPDKAKKETAAKDIAEVVFIAGSDFVTDLELWTQDGVPTSLRHIEAVLPQLEPAVAV